MDNMKQALANHTSKEEVLKEEALKMQALIKEFNNDNSIIGKQTEEFLRIVYPSYLIDTKQMESLLENEPSLQLDGMTFFRIASCTADDIDKAFENLNSKIEKLFAALHSIGVSIGYGLISRDGVTNLVLGVYSNSDVECVQAITQGMLSGVNLEPYNTNFSKELPGNRSFGILSGVPSLYIRDEKQQFSLSSIMRSLNGQNYTLLFLAQPVSAEIVANDISSLIAIRDEAFGVSKRNISRSNGYSSSATHTENESDTKNSNASTVAAGLGSAIGAGICAIPGSIIPGAGTAVGIMVGGAVGGGLGTVIGAIAGKGKSHTEGFSASVSRTITGNTSISGEVQNGFALELMNYADTAIDRLKSGRNVGVWQTSIAYSADTTMARNIVKACLCGELSKPDPDKLPLLAFEPNAVSKDVLRFPSFLSKSTSNPLCSYMNSDELGLLCTVPTECVPDFDLRIEKSFPMVRSYTDSDSTVIGNVVDGKRTLSNMPFALSSQDINKHMLVCGITGSGKTTTVKRILKEAQVPFLVIESAKKEYRNLDVDTTVYTLGRPEINCPQINPFYIMPGVSPQMHIDYLKDLFNASFSFYGPMPYILEKCLHTVYSNKGWNLTLGYHPMLSNCASRTDFFDIDYVQKKYQLASHKYIFPTMQELKDEIVRYIETELKYDGEVAGNVKTAMQVRLENLCVGAKGFTFNTSDYLDFDKLLDQNVVFELEGLADDADKAFGVGLLVIYINELRQIKKETMGIEKIGLQHILVIEEAHRLLKNVETEQSSESSGNPKGKAVEHFTNMIAEMRSYGQGVIVAEQIPTKLAPDVIKNTSTKIVHRVVSFDDQQTMANTIGLAEDRAMQLGVLESGYALCHKEGMALPTVVKVSNTYTDISGTALSLDVFVSDEGLYNRNRDQFAKINMATIRNILDNEEVTKLLGLRLLNTLFIESSAIYKSGCESAVKQLTSCLYQKDAQLILCDDITKVVADYLSEVLLNILLRGVYCAPELPADEVLQTLHKTFYVPAEKYASQLRAQLAKVYGCNIEKFATQNIVELIRRILKSDTDIDGTVRGYFTNVSDKTVATIVAMLKEV